MYSMQSNTPPIHMHPKLTGTSGWLRQWAVGSWLPPLFVSVVCFVGAQFSYLLFHAMAELVSIVIAFTALIVATHSRGFTKNHFVYYVATVIGWCAGLDLLHTLVFQGMHLLPTNSANPPTELWIAARFLQAAALLVSPLFLKHVIRSVPLHVVLGLITACLVWLIATDHFPTMYVDGQGLTPLKIYSEYVIILMLSATLFFYWRLRPVMSPRLFNYMGAALVAMIFSEFAFTQYVSVIATANLVGHVLKIFAYWFIYLGLVYSTLTRPFSMLSRVSSTFDSIPDPTLVVTLEGALLQANQAACTWVNTPLEGLIEHASHDLFHDPSIAAQSCPVCVRIARGEALFTEVIRIQQPERILECNIAPYQIDNGFQARVEVVRDITERDRASKKIQDLTYLYEMLSATNRAIVRCNSSGELLAALFDTMVKGHAFPMLFIAMTDTGEQPLRIVHAHGFSIEHLSDLATSLASPHSVLGRLIQTLEAGKIISLPVTEKDSNDPWVNYLYEEKITNRAVVPLMVDNRLMGVMGLYTRDIKLFDAQQLLLLEQMSSDVSFALSSMRASERTEQAEESAKLSEHRFSEIFDASPSPLQLMNVKTGKMLGLNRAFQLWLGYTLNDIPNEQAWFELAYPTQELQTQLRAAWTQSIANARRDHRAQNSPEFSIQAKDGSMRVCTGSMTLVGDEAIIAWTDLSDIRAKERELIASEKHFRNMIEQSVAGIYVRRNGRFVYVNPRYCEITGWSPHELLDHSVLDFTTSDPDNIQHIENAWAALDTESPSVTYSVPVKHKSGQWLELELHAKAIDWDGQIAHIVLVDDITERKRQEAKIAQYVRQLEGSMESTLRAISSMVDMRDPYTAGHERRVGLIASEIAHEMGWATERSKSLELIGLVHDIGKIAVPVEILTKPTRLTPLEMQLVQGHAQAGYDILKNVSFPLPIADIIGQHHERMDGSGYPKGLTGDQILAEARVLAVADVLESMSSHRPYRAALGIDAAMDELKKNRSRLYDPEVVDAAIRLIETKNYKLPT